MLENQLQPDYRLYVTLLDAFSWYLKSEKEDAEKEFIDKINRVPFTSEAAEKGTAFNEVVDMDITDVSTLDVVPCGQFEFPTSLVKEVQERVAGAVPQYFTSRIFKTGKGLVELYGYIDYLQFTKAVDLKTCKEYSLGKYANTWQRLAYPFCLAGEGIFMDEFEYLVTDFENVYSEPYPVDLWEAEALIKIHVENLIEFIEARKDKITDKKLFNQQQEAA